MAEKKEFTVKVRSPIGGRAISVCIVGGDEDDDGLGELMKHLSRILSPGGLGLKTAFERVMDSEWQKLPWSDAEKCPGIIQKLNKCIASIVSLWRGVTHLHKEWEYFKSPLCDANHARALCQAVFNTVVKKAEILDKCYKSFSSLTYGETTFDQLQIIFDRLQMTEEDVFVDLGSGVGNVVTYAAASTKAKKCVGIELNEIPAEMATRINYEFKNVMSFYGKKHRPFELIQGDFLSDEHHELITEEATVIFINNYAFDSNLMFHVKDKLKNVLHGTRIVVAKSFSEERDRTEKSKNMTPRASSNRSLNRQTFDMMLDCEELPMAADPVSWSSGNGVQFLLYTANQAKLEKMFELSKKDIGGASQANGDLSEDKSNDASSLTCDSPSSSSSGNRKRRANNYDEKTFYKCKILRRKVEDGKKMCYVSWKGYGRSWNSWVEESSIEDHE